MEPRPDSDAGFWALPSWSSRSDLSGWFDETAWWNSPTLSWTPQRALIELLEAVAGRFTGRELALQYGTHAVRLRVDAVQVRGRPSPSAVADPLRWLVETSGVSDLLRWSRGVIGLDTAGATSPVDAVEFDTSDVHVDGLPVGTVSVRLDGVRLDPGVPFPDLVTGPIDFDVRTTRELVSQWLRRELPAWDIRPRPRGLIELRMPKRRIRVLVRPTVETRAVHFETIGIVVLRRDVRLPRFLVRTRVYDFPPLDPSVELVDVSVTDDDVVIRLRHEGIRKPMRLDVLRAAVRDGATKLSDAILQLTSDPGVNPQTDPGG